MAAVYRLDLVSGHCRFEFPAFVRDSVIGDARKVIVEASEDSEGKFLRIRPIRGVE